jgi:hypothetical protein
MLLTTVSNNELWWQLKFLKYYFVTLSEAKLYSVEQQDNER